MQRGRVHGNMGRAHGISGVVLRGALAFLLAMPQALLGASVANAAALPSTQMLTTNAAGGPSDGSQIMFGDDAPVVSADGRYVAFASIKATLVSGDTNGQRDVFVRDRVSGTTTRISVGPGGVEASKGSKQVAISADGGRVAFVSLASNLVADDTNGVEDVFVWTRATGTLERVSVSTAGGQSSGACAHPSISPDGGWVAFESAGSNLVPDDLNGAEDVFLRDLAAGATTRVSLRSDGGESTTSASYRPSVSEGAAVIAFESMGALVSGDTNRVKDVYVRDRLAGTTERISLTSAGAQVPDAGDVSGYSSGSPAISSDGRYVAFVSNWDGFALALRGADSNGAYDVFRRDRVTGTTALASTKAGSTIITGDADSGLPAISGNGRVVAFRSLASNLVSGDTNATYDVFARDFAASTTTRMSVTDSGTQTAGASDMPALTFGGGAAIFWSQGSDLVSGDTNGYADVFARTVREWVSGSATSDAFQMERDTTLTVSGTGVLENDSAPLDLLAEVVSSPSHGALTATSDGRFTYVPARSFTGTVTFTYSVFDGIARSLPATVSIQVVDKPVVAADTYSVAHDRQLSVVASAGVLINDFDPSGDPITAAVHVGPAHGALALGPDGSFTYSPVASYVGTDTFTYRASDGTTLSPDATVSIRVYNNAPVITTHTYAVNQEATLSVGAPGLLDGASDPEGDAISVSAASTPAHGIVTRSANDGRFVYRPASGYYGTDAFSYTVTDGLRSSTATVAVAVNGKPIALADSAYAVAHDKTLVVAPSDGVLANDRDPECATMTASLASDVAHGTLSLLANGGFTYTPASGYWGSDSFTYVASDGTATSGPTGVTISVLDNAPAIIVHTYRVNQDATLTVDVPGLLESASDADTDVLAVSAVATPLHGKATWGADGGLTYRPSNGWHGTENFSYTVSDGVRSSLSTVTVLVNARPVAVANSYAVAEDTTLTTGALGGFPGVLANDIDPDSPLHAHLVAGPSHGVLTFSEDGSFEYVPSIDFNGLDSFTYYASDGSLDSTVTTVALTVTPVADPALLVLRSSEATISYGGSYSILGTITVNGAPLVGKRVWLQSASLGTTLTTSTSVWATSTTGGAFRFTVKPSRKTVYAACVKEDTVTFAAVSATLTVAPKVYLSSLTSARSGTRYYKFSGTVKPDHSSSYRVYVYYQRSGSATITSGGYAYVKDRGSYSSWYKYVKFPAKATYYVWIVMKSDALHAETLSPKKKLSVY